jgi:hypothetical protein
VHRVIALAAVVPQPPLLVPELVAGAVGETAELRAACESAARRLTEAGARKWLAIGVDASGPRTVRPPASGSFAGYGVHVPVSLAPVAASEAAPVSVNVASAASSWTNATSTEADGRAAAGDGLALPLLVAGWLRGRMDVPVTVVGELVHPGAGAADCAERGRELAMELAGDEPVGLLVLGDGASTHAAEGAGRVDERAGPFDEAVRLALATADAGALLALDAALADDVGATGRPAWQVLAGAVSSTGAPWEAELLYSAAPYGVGYHVAVWEPSP